MSLDLLLLIVSDAFSRFFFFKIFHTLFHTQNTPLSALYIHRRSSQKRLNHGSEWSHQLTQRDCLWKHGVALLRKKIQDRKKQTSTTPPPPPPPPQPDEILPELDDHTLFLFTDVDEIPDRELVHHLKMCELTKRALPAHLRMRVNGHNFRVQCSDGMSSYTGASEVSEWRTIKEDGGVVYRFRAPSNVKPRRKNALHDAGVHLTWYGSMAFVDYKGFTHAEGGYFSPMWSSTPTSKRRVAGSYCDSGSSERGSRVMEERQLMSNEMPLKFVRFWERHEETRLRSVLERVKAVETEIEEERKKGGGSGGSGGGGSTEGATRSGNVNQEKERLYKCNLPWIAIENPERFIWFWGEGKASDIDRLADTTILEYLPSEEEEKDEKDEKDKKGKKRRR